MHRVQNISNIKFFLVMHNWHFFKHRVFYWVCSGLFIRKINPLLVSSYTWYLCYFYLTHSWRKLEINELISIWYGPSVVKELNWGYILWFRYEINSFILRFAMQFELMRSSDTTTNFDPKMFYKILQYFRKCYDVFWCCQGV